MQEHRSHHLPSCRQILVSAARLQSTAFYLLASSLRALLSFAVARQWLRLRSRGRLSATLAARSSLSTVQSFLHSLFARYPKAPDNRQTFHLQQYESRYSPSARQLVYRLVQLLERKSAVLPIAFDFRQAQKHRKPVQKRLCPSTFEIVLPFEKSLHASAGSSEQLPFQADAQKTAPLLHRGHRVPCRSAPAAGSFVQ